VIKINDPYREHGADAMPSFVTDARLVLPLRGVSYDFYSQLRREPANRPLRMTYHNGTLEIMSPLYRHEKYSRRLGLIVLAVAAVLGIPCQGAGSTTFRRRGKRMLEGWGKEPDQSFYLANESRIRGKEEIDLEVDPPPDLWIEVGHRGSSRGRLPLYASLEIPEIWRFRTKSQMLWFGRLDGGAYTDIERSVALPLLTPQRVLESLRLGDGLSESEWDVVLRAWAAELVAR
jgi:Uma2 family endonuclease